MGVQSMTFHVEHAQWLTDRGLNPELAAKFGMRSADIKVGGLFRKGIAIPYLDKGREMTTKVRWLDEREPKWTHPSGGKLLWNQDSLLEKSFLHLPLCVTEGEWDALAAILAGYHRTVSVPAGAKSKFELTDVVKQAIATTRKIILCGDNDPAGRIMNAECARRFGAARCYYLEYPDGCKDLNEVLIYGGLDAVRETVETARPYPIKGLYTLYDYPDVDQQAVYSTGWPNLDPYLQFWRGEFCVVTGVPSHGKSRWCLELMASLNRHHQHKAAIASFEMPIVPHVRDILREHYINKKRADLTDEDKARADAWMQTATYFIDQNPATDTEEANLEWIVERCEDAVSRYGVDWTLVDPWNQIEHRRAPFENEVDYQNRAIRAFKRFARVYSCGVFMVVHPTKSIVDKTGKVRRPTLYDVSGSAHWYNAADHGIVIWRDDVTDSKMTVSCLKSRFREAGKPGAGGLELTSGRLQPTGPTYGSYNV